MLCIFQVFRFSLHSFGSFHRCEHPSLATPTSPQPPLTLLLRPVLSLVCLERIYNGSSEHFFSFYFFSLGLMAKKGIGKKSINEGRRKTFLLIAFFRFFFFSFRMAQGNGKIFFYLRKKRKKMLLGKKRRRFAWAAVELEEIVVALSTSTVRSFGS